MLRLSRLEVQELLGARQSVSLLEISQIELVAFSCVSLSYRLFLLKSRMFPY